MGEDREKHISTEDVPNLEGLKELENQLFLLTMKYTTLRNFKWRTSFEEAMRSDHSSKWLEVMEDEMKSMNIN